MLTDAISEFHQFYCWRASLGWCLWNSLCLWPATLAVGTLDLLQPLINSGLSRSEYKRCMPEDHRQSPFGGRLALVSGLLSFFWPRMGSMKLYLLLLLGTYAIAREYKVPLHSGALMLHCTCTEILFFILLHPMYPISCF